MIGFTLMYSNSREGGIYSPDLPDDSRTIVSTISMLFSLSHTHPLAVGGLDKIFYPPFLG